MARVIAVAICTAGSLAAAPPAGAAAPCYKGSVCVYDHSGRLVFQSAGNVSNANIAASYGTVWNNGYPDRGRDHVTLWTRTPGGQVWRNCVHYGPMSFGPEPPTAVYVWPGDSVVTGWTWRGECQPGEDHWVPA